MSRTSVDASTARTIRNLRRALHAERVRRFPPRTIQPGPNAITRMAGGALAVEGCRALIEENEQSRTWVIDDFHRRGMAETLSNGMNAGFAKKTVGSGDLAVQRMMSSHEGAWRVNIFPPPDGRGSQQMSSNCNASAQKLLPVWVNSPAVQCAQSWRAERENPPGAPASVGWRTSPARMTAPSGSMM